MFGCRSERSHSLSPTLTSRSLADSGIESLVAAQQHSQIPAVPVYSCGNAELDAAIIQHCALTEVLLEVSALLCS